MTEFLQSLFITSLFIFGVNCVFSDGFILGPIGNWMERKLPNWLYLPLVGCPSCQSSIWGTLFFFVMNQFDFTLWPIFCISLCGLNTIVSKLISKIITIDE